MPNVIEVWEISFPDGPVRRISLFLGEHYSTSARRCVQIDYSPRTHSPDRPKPILNSALLWDRLRCAAGGNFFSRGVQGLPLTLVSSQFLAVSRLRDQPSTRPSRRASMSNLASRPRTRTDIIRKGFHSEEVISAWDIRGCPMNLICVWLRLWRMFYFALGDSSCKS
jgi:hypothetical protein